MRFSIPPRARMSWLGAGLALTAMACDRSEQVLAPSVSRRPTVGLEVSSRSASSGQRVAVALANTSSAAIGGIQGTLKFDAARLRFRGQVRDGSDELLLVNADRADRGELRI